MDYTGEGKDLTEGLVFTEILRSVTVDTCMNVGRFPVCPPMLQFVPSTSNLHFYTLLPLASVYIKYFRQIIFLMVLILNVLVCINLQNSNNPHTCSVTHFFLFNGCHAPLRGPQNLNAEPGVGEGGFLKLLKKLLLKLKTGQMAINFALTCSSAILMCFTQSTQSTDTFMMNNV